MESHLWTVLWISLGSGSFGGVINYFFLDSPTPNTDATATVKEYWFYKMIKSIIIGVGASFVVPLFLQTISSELIDKCKTDSKQFFVYAGFCLLAAIFSRRFLDSVAEQALKVAKKTDQKVNNAIESAKEAQEEASLIANKLTEPDEGEERIEDDLEISDPDFIEKARTDVKSILKILTGSKYVFRTSKGIAKEISSDDKIVELILEEMEGLGLARKVIKEDKVLWAPTELGLKKIRK